MNIQVEHGGNFPVKTSHVVYIHRGNPLGKKPLMNGVTYLCAGSFRLLQTSVRLCESGDK